MILNKNTRIELQEIIEKVYKLSPGKESIKVINNCVNLYDKISEQGHLPNSSIYKNDLIIIKDLRKKLTDWLGDLDLKVHANIQRAIVNLARKILDENKRVFIVHGRNREMRESVSALLGRLKIDYVILDSETNAGSTVIEKFLNHAQECHYAIVLFSADDLGKLNQDDQILQPRARQNVILELGYFLSAVGRKNIAVLHEIGPKTEAPSDFSGIVDLPFDEYGAWKNKLLKEMRFAGIYIDKNQLERI